MCSTIIELMLNSCSASPEPAASAAPTLVVAPDRPGSLRLCGELDVAGVPEVWARLVGIDGDVELDCAGLTFIDASGLRLLVAVHAGCQARGAKLSIVNPSRCVTRLVELTRLERMLDGRAVSSVA